MYTWKRLGTTTGSYKLYIVHRRAAIYYSIWSQALRWLYYKCKGAVWRALVCVFIFSWICVRNRAFVVQTAAYKYACSVYICIVVWHVMYVHWSHQTGKTVTINIWPMRWRLLTTMTGCARALLFTIGRHVQLTHVRTSARLAERAFDYRSNIGYRPRFC